MLRIFLNFEWRRLAMEKKIEFIWFEYKGMLVTSCYIERSGRTYLSLSWESSMKKLGSFWIHSFFLSLLIGGSSMLHGANMERSLGEIMVGVPTQVLTLEDGTEVPGYRVWNSREDTLEPGGFVASTAYVAGKRKPQKRSRFRWSSVEAPKETDIYVLTSCYLGQNARVLDVARVFGNARVYGHAQIIEKAQIFGEAHVFDYARIRGKAVVYGNARVCDNALLMGYSRVCGGAWVHGSVQIGGSTDHSFEFVRGNVSDRVESPHEAPMVPTSSGPDVPQIPVVMAKREVTSEDMCTVCTEKWQATPEQVLLHLPCTHLFHRTCFLQWLNAGAGENTCPDCRYTLSDTQIQQYKKSQ
jgi:carbonic anhydrase/acetyltransferase-like protein (isoleucine patch superfamily)